MATAKLSDGSNSVSTAELQRLGGFAVLGGIGMILSAVAAAQHAHPSLQAFGVLLMTGTLGMASGAILGFLFGIPRVSAQVPVTTADRESVARVIRSNTNLEEISDWLSKIIVGLSLSQIAKAGDYFARFRDVVASSVGGGDQLTPVLATFVLVVSVIIGFLWIYLETRIILTRIFDSVEKSLNDQVVAKLSSALEQAAQSAPSGIQALAPAADALKSAVTLKPGDATLRSVAVKALAASGRGGEASAIVSGRTTASDYLSRMLLALYKEPDGYDETIKLSAAAPSEARELADYWFYLAAAFGQKHAATRARDPDSPELLGLRDNVLDCARRAIALDAGARQRLRELAFPATSTHPQDDDLQSLSDDPAIRELLGSP